MNTITINGNDYPFRLTISGLSAIESKTGKSIEHIDQVGIMTLVLTVLPIAINAGYRQQQSGERITEEQVMNLVDDDPSCISKVSEIMTSQMESLMDKVNGADKKATAKKK